MVCIINITHCAIAIHRNTRWGNVTGNRFPRASLKHNEKNTSISITVELSRPLEIDAGQYINLWIWAPKVNIWSWTQSHPFVVTSWLPKEQSSLELLVQPHRGLTSDLSKIKKALECSAFISGPHGLVIPVWEPKSVIMVAMDFGIAAMLPYLAKLIHGYRTFASRTCRIHVVWHVKELQPFETVLYLLNQYLDNDKVLIKVRVAYLDPRGKAYWRNRCFRYLSITRLGVNKEFSDPMVKSNTLTMRQNQQI